MLDLWRYFQSYSTCLFSVASYLPLFRRRRHRREFLNRQRVSSCSKFVIKLDYTLGLAFCRGSWRLNTQVAKESNHDDACHEIELKQQREGGIFELLDDLHRSLEPLVRDLFGFIGNSVRGKSLRMTTIRGNRVVDSILVIRVDRGESDSTADN